MSRNERRILIIGAIAILLVVAAVGYTAYARHAEAVEQAEVYSRLLVYCAEYHAQNNLPSGQCTWTGSNRIEVTRECHRQNPILDYEFRQCLSREGIRPL